MFGTIGSLARPASMLRMLIVIVSACVAISSTATCGGSGALAGPDVGAAVVTATGSKISPAAAEIKIDRNNLHRIRKTPFGYRFRRIIGEVVRRSNGESLIPVPGAAEPFCREDAEEQDAKKRRNGSVTPTSWRIGRLGNRDAI